LPVKNENIALYFKIKIINHHYELFLFQKENIPTNITINIKNTINVYVILKLYIKTIIVKKISTFNIVINNGFKLSFAKTNIIKIIPTYN
jgi:hypothetical protein